MTSIFDGPVDTHTAEPAGKPDRPARGPSVADQLRDLAAERYTFGCSAEGDLYALPIDGPPVARMLRGGRRSMRAELAAAYAERVGKAPSATALADVMLVLEGTSQQASPAPLHLRVAPHADGIRLDLGRLDGLAVDVSSDGWLVAEPGGGPLFRRTELTGELPIPERGGSLEELRALLNVTDRDWPLLVGWLVAAYDPRIPRPALLLTGEQGTGKTTTARYLVELLDPSPAPLRSAPRDEHSWAVSASASWVVGVDNLSTIPPWLSDAMCRAVTGDGVLTRRLYTDSELAVLAFRRALLLTSIDLGALRGDLADRLLTVELERISAGQRRTDNALRVMFAEAHPRLLGALLDLLARVLAALPEARRLLADRSRMADFSEVLAAVDLVTGSATTAAYAEAGRRLAADVVEGDPVAAAVRALMVGRSEWRGSAAELLDALTGDDDHRRPRDWPGTARALAGRVLRAAPALRTVGVVVEQGKSHGSRWYRLQSADRGTVEPPGGTVEPPRGTVAEPYRPPETGRSEPETPPRGTVGTVGSIPSPTCLLQKEKGGQEPQEEVRERPSAPSPPSPTSSAGLGPCVTCGTATRRYGASGAPRCEPCQVLAATRLPNRRRLYADAVREAAS